MQHKATVTKHSKHDKQVSYVRTSFLNLEINFINKLNNLFCCMVSQIQTNRLKPFLDGMLVIKLRGSDCRANVCRKKAHWSLLFHCLPQY
jgi:hypothetical protein